MKVAGWAQSSSVPITYRAYYVEAVPIASSDTAAVTSCSIAKSVREVVNCNKLNKVFSGTSYSYTASRQDVELIRANVFYSTFLNVFYFVHVFLRFLTFFIFSRTFFTSMHQTRRYCKFTVRTPSESARYTRVSGLSSGSKRWRTWYMYLSFKTRLNKTGQTSESLTSCSINVSHFDRSL